MSLTNAIKAFINPPDDNSSASDSTTDSSESNSSQPDIELRGDGDGVPVSNDTEETDKDITTRDGTTPSVNAKQQVEGKYWPYKIQPTDKESVSKYEILQKGYPILNSEGDLAEEEDMYMGKWPRSMIESSGHRKNPETWMGYQDDPIQGVDEGGIPFEYLFRHSLVFGETGQGKTTLLMNMMLQWIFAGYGCCFIDPKGAGDAKELIQRIPPKRQDDIIWIEPGSRREKMIGFNLLETDTKEGDEDWNDEVEKVVEQFNAVIENTEDGSGAVINEVTQEITRYLVKQEYNYNVLDLFAILYDEEDRKKLPETESDHFSKKALKTIAEKDDDDFNSIRRRVRPWVTDVTTREILDVRDTGVNLTKAIEDGKILIVKTNRIPEQDVQEMFVTAFVRRIWSTIERRAELDKSEFDPYFLVCDEFDDVAIDRLGIGEMLSKARAFKFGITLATQQPSMLEPPVANAVFKNSKNIFTFSPGNHEDSVTLAKELGDEMDSGTLKDLGKYHIAGKIMANDKPNTVVLKSFAPYPPLHTPEYAEEIIQNSLDKYGKVKTDKEWDVEKISEEYGVRDLDKETKTVDSEKFQITKDDAISVPEFLRYVYTAQVTKGSRTFNGKDGYIHEQDLEEIIEERYGESSYKAVGRIGTEEITDDLLESEMDDAVYFRLTEKGLAKAFEQDTGHGGSSGGSAHRKLLSKAWKEFTKLGYDVTLPTQEDWGDDPPDGVAIPPIRPVADSNNDDEYNELKSLLQSEYGRIWELFKDYEVSLEAETSTKSKPKQTIKNLAKAINRNQKCVLITNERTTGSYEENPYEDATPTEVLELNARQVYNIFKNPPFVADMDEDGNRKFYTLGASRVIELKDGSVALEKETPGHTVWREDGKKVILESDSDEDTISFRKPEQIMNKPSRQKFNYRYEKDKRNNLIVVKNAKNEVVEEYDNTTQMKDDGWKPIIGPCVPENMFPDGYPSEDDWMILVSPRASNPEYDSDKLYIYNPDGDGDMFEPLVQPSVAETEEEEIGSPVESDAGSASTDDTVSKPKVSKPKVSKPTIGGADETSESDAEEPEIETEDTVDEPEVENDKPTEKPSTKQPESESEDDPEPTPDKPTVDTEDAFSDYRNDDDKSEMDKPTVDNTPNNNKKPTTTSTTNNSDDDTEDTEKPSSSSKPVEATSDTKETEEPTSESQTDSDIESDDSQPTEDQEADEAEDEEVSNEEDNSNEDEEVWGDYKSSSIDL